MEKEKKVYLPQSPLQREPRLPIIYFCSYWYIFQKLCTSVWPKCSAKSCHCYRISSPSVLGFLVTPLRRMKRQTRRSGGQQSQSLLGNSTKHQKREGTREGCHQSFQIQGLLWALRWAVLISLTLPASVTQSGFCYQPITWGRVEGSFRGGVKSC